MMSLRSWEYSIRILTRSSVAQCEIGVKFTYLSCFPWDVCPGSAVERLSAQASDLGVNRI